MPHRSSATSHTAVLLLTLLVTAGTTPLLRSSGSIVVFIPLILLLWFGLPAIVGQIIPRHAVRFAAVVNLCTVLSLAVWPTPWIHNRWTDPLYWIGLAVGAIIAVSFSTIVSVPIQRRYRTLDGAPKRSFE